MTAVNHVITGSVVAAAVSNPVFGLPLAFLSHFVLDALPHFGLHAVAHPKSKEFRAVILTDAILTVAFLVIVTFVSIRTNHGLILVLGGFLGWVPDALWYKHYKNDLRNETKKWDSFSIFHKKIQRWERSWGWVIEVAWFVVLVAALHQLVY